MNRHAHPRMIGALMLGRRAYLDIAAEAQARFPDECCGVLVGAVRAGRAYGMRAVPAANVAADRARHFEIDPVVLFTVQRALREDGRGDGHGKTSRRPRESILGYFHSHPAGVARPSGADLAGAHEVGLVTLIAAPPRRTGPMPLHAWLRLGHGGAQRFRPLRLEIGA